MVVDSRIDWVDNHFAHSKDSLGDTPLWPLRVDSPLRVADRFSAGA